MKTITFQFHRGDALVSRAIRLLSPVYNHVSIKVGTYVYEAHIGVGVIKTKVKDWDHSTVVDKISWKVTDTGYKRVKKWGDKQLGKKYDLLGIVSFVWGFTKPKNGKWYCSELAKGMFLKANDIHFDYEDKQQKISPYQWKKELELIDNVLYNRIVIN